MADTIRLDKFLVEMKQGSRSQIREMAKKGRVSVNQVPEKKADRKINPNTDRVCVDGREITYHAVEYYMLNKPQGVVSATADNRDTTVIDLLEEDVRKDLFPVGRLDKDTEGLLLLTNDGDLAHRLLSPRKHVDKIYYARIEGTLPKDAVKQMATGIHLEDGVHTMPAKLEILNPEGNEVCLTIHEGKFHQVKRMFLALGCEVVYLKRLSMGPLKLDESLRPGEYRRLTNEELEQLL